MGLFKIFSSKQKYSKKPEKATRFALTQRFPAVIEPQYTDVFRKILSYLNVEELCAASAVNKRWRQMALDIRLWKNLYDRNFNTLK